LNQVLESVVEFNELFRASSLVHAHQGLGRGRLEKAVPGHEVLCKIVQQGGVEVVIVEKVDEVPDQVGVEAGCPGIGRVTWRPCVPKDGRRMPCVVTMHQHSETQSKPSYFRGHYWGAIGMLIGSMGSPFCIPLSLGIHQGLVHVNEKGKAEEDKETLGNGYADCKSQKELCGLFRSRKTDNKKAGTAT
jgi:hypothetical protein